MNENQPMNSSDAIQITNGVQLDVAKQSIEKPKFCIYQCHTCQQRPNYLEKVLLIPNLIHQTKINEELSLHGHNKIFQKIFCFKMQIQKKVG